jgi:hypothetical protein
MGKPLARVEGYEIRQRVDCFEEIYCPATDRINPEFVEEILDEYEALRRTAEGRRARRAANFVKRIFQKGGQAGIQVPPVYKITVEVPERDFADCAINSYEDIITAVDDYCLEKKERALETADRFGKSEKALVFGCALGLTVTITALTAAGALPPSKLSVIFNGIGPEVFTVAGGVCAIEESVYKHKAAYYTHIKDVRMEFEPYKPTQ